MNPKSLAYKIEKLQCPKSVFKNMAWIVCLPLFRIFYCRNVTEYFCVYTSPLLVTFNMNTCMHLGIA